MKIRSGFVSNSSSASFVLDWVCKTEGKENIDYVLAKLFKIFCFTLEDIETYSLPPIKEEDFKSISDEIDGMYDCTRTMHYIKYITVPVGNGNYRTTFETYMLNNHKDFGECFQELMAVLAIQNAQTGNRDFEIIRMTLNDDGNY